MLTLSKSDFKVAQSCVTKLYYKKKRYPTTNDDNDYMKMLADGGYMVGKLAQLMYENGIEIIETNSDKAVEQTNEFLKQKNVTLFEAAIRVHNFIIRIDILEKRGDIFNLIEVKAKSIDSTNLKEIDSPAFKPYVEDVVFQTYALQEYLKVNQLKAEVNPFLLLADKRKTTSIEGLCGWFKKLGDYNFEKSGGFRKIEYEFIYPLGSEQHKQLIKENILTKVSVQEQANKLLPIIENAAKKYSQLLDGTEPLKEQTCITLKCFKCEYKTEGETCGYRECWGELANSVPHISELYYLGSKPMGDKANKLIAERKTCLFDIKTEDCVTTKGGIGARDERRIIQIENTRSNTEFFKTAAKSEIRNWKYPLYFIDFETSTNALPFHSNMRPYETIAFQWSCHVIENENSEPKHYEWINTEPEFPNFKFVVSLMNCVGNNGTPLMWSHHENTVLRHILEQMEIRKYENPKLKQWLIEMTTEKEEREGRLLDMCKFCADNYFHPYMKGKVSIKKVLPAIWNHNSYLHEVSFLKKYFAQKEGVILSPYETLKPLADIKENDEFDEDETDAYCVVIKEGTAAMRAYYQMMFEFQNDNVKIEELKNLLLQYCELDTMAMVIIWKHWMKLAKNNLN